MAARRTSQRAPLPLPLPLGGWTGDALTLVLPMPGSVLGPNGTHGHWRTKHRAKKRARGVARMLTLATLSQLGEVPAGLPVGYSLRYFWRSNRRDDDNAIASAKAHLDGICEALQMDDRDLRFRELIHERDSKLPRLEVILHFTKTT